MAIHIADQALADQFRGQDNIAVTGPDGQVLAMFMRVTAKNIPIGISDDELEARYTSPGRWYTADEVMAKLRELSKEPPKSGTNGEGK